jgi:serine/threonine protein kinase/tetratricopeptide (TPR) repeat protein
VHCPQHNGIAAGTSQEKFLLVDIVGTYFGRYEIIEQLGEGGMASVYKAYDDHLDRHVAVKMIFPNFQQAELLAERFKREVQTLAGLMHPNIAQVLDYGEHENILYFIMPYAPGKTLKERMGVPMPWADAARMLIPIAQALTYAHRKGIIHRDVKPANILLSETGAPILSDFGTVKLQDSKEIMHLTSTGMGIGTPDYMAPEQWLGNVVVQTDIYAMGVVFYEMVTGRLPYSSDTPAAVLLKQASETPPRPKEFAWNMPDAVEEVILKALAREVEDRYDSMEIFGHALEDLERYREIIAGGMIGRTIPEEDLDAMLDALPDEPIEDEQSTLDVPVDGEEETPPQAATNRNLWRWAAGGLAATAIIAAFLLLGDPFTLAGNTPTPTTQRTLAVADVKMTATKPQISPTATYTATPSATRAVTSTPEMSMTPTALPLQSLLKLTYTPTPLYVNTPHPEYMGYGEVLDAYQQGDWAAAQAGLKDMIDAGIESPDIYYLLGETYRFQGMIRTALDIYDQIVETDSGFAPAYLGQGRVYMSTAFDNPADARMILRQAISDDPFLVEAYFELANAEIKLLHYDLALGYLETAARYNSTSPELYALRAQAHLGLGNIDRAISNAQRANELDTTHLLTYRILGEAYIADDNLAEAHWPLSTYTTYVSDDAQAWAWLGMTYVYYQEIDTAYEILNQAIELKSNLFDARLTRGQLYLDEEEYDLARQDFATALGTNPDHLIANIGMGTALVALEKYEPALFYFNQAQVYATSAINQAQIYYWRGRAYDALDDDIRAVSDYRQLLALIRSAVPEAWAQIASERMAAMATATPTRSPTATRQNTITPRSTVTSPPTATRAPTLTATRTPTARRTTQAASSPTKQPSATLAPTQTATRTPTARRTTQAASSPTKQPSATLAPTLTASLTATRAPTQSK